MLICPVCQGSIKDDFGLMDCDHCGAPLIVHFDGTVEHAKALPPADVSDEPVASEEALPDEGFAGDFSEPVEPSMVSFDGTPEPEPELEPEGELQPQADFSEAVEPEVQPEEAVEPAGDFAEQPVAAPTEPAETPIYRSEPEKNPADLSDLAAYGNGDVNSGREGPLRYNLFISGIDTKDVREAFREALTDRKFVWDTDQILRSIKHGQVKIENATASKAYLLVVRLRNLPVQIRWEQYVVHQS